MRKVFLFIFFLFSCYYSEGQMIKKVDSIHFEEDSSTLNYSLQVRFDKSGTREQRLALVKVYLEENYQVKPDKIIYSHEWLHKRHRTYRYLLKTAKN